MTNDNNNPGKPLTIIVVAVAIVIALSLVPWSDLTNGKIKDYNLLSDLFDKPDKPVTGNEIIDPDLLKEMEQITIVAKDTNSPDTIHITDNTEQTSIPDTNAAQPLAALIPPQRDIADKPSRIDGHMVMEDYSPDGDGLKNIKRALANSSMRPVRIAVLGDSYIEGDIFTQDVRSRLQERFGGRGVGYMPAHSIVQGFRASVGHKDSGWTNVGIRDNKCKYYVLPGEYHTGAKGASITYRGTKKEGLKSWSSSRVLFIAPASGTITITTDNGDTSFDIEASDLVQQVRVDGETSLLTINSDIPGLVHLGSWLEDDYGVSVDNMSIRGYSGIKHRSLDPQLAAQLRQFTDYNLIVVEYGINALSSTQSDYTQYSNMMAAMLTRLKQSYPNADIILMGIGDRGQKIDGEVHSMPTAPHMVQALRRAARNAGVVFWDTREAMGGDDAVVQWRADGNINPDYIHLNAKGGRQLSDLFVNSLYLSIGE